MGASKCNYLMAKWVWCAYVNDNMCRLWWLCFEWRRQTGGGSGAGWVLLARPRAFLTKTILHSLSRLSIAANTRRSQTQTHTGRMHFCFLPAATGLLLCGLSYPFQPLSAKHFRFRVTFGSLANIRRQWNLASPLGISASEGLPAYARIPLFIRWQRLETRTATTHFQLLMRVSGGEWIAFRPLSANHY